MQFCAEHNDDDDDGIGANLNYAAGAERRECPRGE